MAQNGASAKTCGYWVTPIWAASATAARAWRSSSRATDGASCAGHESAPKNFTGIDVTDPRKPSVIVQTDLPHGDMRSNNLDLVGDLLVVPYQTSRVGLKPAGVEFFDVSDPSKPKSVAFFDASGPHSRGVHHLWFVDGAYLHLASGAPDFKPRNRRRPVLPDHRRAAAHAPRRVGRWWLPGTRDGDAEPAPARHPKFDAGFRAHNTNAIPPADRAWIGYIDGGAVILDISDMARPKMLSRWDYHPPYPASPTRSCRSSIRSS